MDKLRNPCIKGKVGDFSADSDLSPPPQKKNTKVAVDLYFIYHYKSSAAPKYTRMFKNVEFLVGPMVQFRVHVDEQKI
jgi:hypothetical protein